MPLRLRLPWRRATSLRLTPLPCILPPWRRQVRIGNGSGRAGDSPQLIGSRLRMCSSPGLDIAGAGEHGATALKSVARATPIYRKTTSGSRTTILPTLACCGLSAVASCGSKETVPRAHRVRAAMATPLRACGACALAIPALIHSRASSLIWSTDQPLPRQRMHAPSYPYESDDLLALTTFVAFQSRGLPIDVRIDGPAQPFFAAGQALYEQRRGQLDLACPLPRPLCRTAAAWRRHQPGSD